MRKCLIWYPVLAWLLSGMMFGVAFLNQGLWWLFVSSMVLWLMAIHHSRTLLQVVWGSWLVGTCKAAGAIAWFWHVYPIDWIDIESGHLQLVIIGVYWIATSIAIGAGMIVAGVSLYLLRNTWWRLITFPFLVVVSEVLGSLLFSLYSLGPGATPNIHFSFGYVGYLLPKAFPLEIIAALGGVYSLSFTAALISLFVYVSVASLQNRNTIRFFTWGSVMAVTVLIAFLFNEMYPVNDEPQKEPIRILAAVTKFPSVSYVADPSLMRNKTETVLEMVFRSLTYDVDIILLPEDTRLTTIFTDPEATLTKLRASGSKATVIDSSRWQKNDHETVMRAFYYDLARDSIHTIDKRYLVPQGEFVPYTVTILSRIFSVRANIDTLAKDQSYRAAPYKVIPEFAYPSILFCSESTSPLLVNKIARTSESNVILHPVSHARFHGSSLLSSQLDTILRVQALANGVTIVSSGNVAESRVYYKDGSVGTGQLMEETPDFKLIEYLIH